jgi:stearoyl-CoA desaturase (delta-9 desaturase)
MDNLLRWFDSARGTPATAGDRVQWLRVVPFLGLHGACLAVLWVGASPVALAVACGSYVVRMFAITAFYHRYFAHRAFRTGRIAQFCFALLGATATQRGPLWWAAHHRNHHRHADTDRDPHGAGRGFWWAHTGWFLTDRNFATDAARVRDWRRFPELRWLDRFDAVPPLLLAAAMFALGSALGRWAPGLGTDGMQMLVWGYVVSTVVLLHATFLVNSLAHRRGSRRFETADGSRNNWLLAVITLGEGWHNNHHRFPGAARQGIAWWEFDLTYLGLKALARLGLVSNLRPLPAAAERAVR